MTDITWTNCVVRLGDLKPWADNPRTSSKAQAERIINSFLQFNQVLPFAISPDDEIYDGHQRASAIKALQEGRYKFHFADDDPRAPILLMLRDQATEYEARRSSRPLTDDERRGLVLALANATGSWNWDKLGNWDNSMLSGWGFDKETWLGWRDDVDNLKELINSNEQEAAETASDEYETKDRFEEIAAKWQTADKQLWQVGEHYLYCGDSLDPESIAIVLHGQEPALVIADPPYGVSIVAANVSVGGGESERGMIPFGGVKNRRGTVGASKPFGSKAERGSVGAAHIVEVGKYPVVIGDESTETAKKAIALYLERFDNAYHAWFGANYYVESVKPSSCWLVWNKETTGNFADCELAWTNADMPAKLFTHRWNGMLRDSEREKRWHPTQKPAALAEWICGLFTEPSDVILDPFGGAGWSVLAAQASNRKACIIEKSHQYLAVQLERLSVKYPHLPITRLDAGG